MSNNILYQNKMNTGTTLTASSQSVESPARRVLGEEPSKPWRPAPGWNPNSLANVIDFQVGGVARVATLAIGNYPSAGAISTEIEIRMLEAQIKALMTPTAWLAADKLLQDGVPNGASIASWTDISGNSRHFTQATVLRQPTLVASDPLIGGRPSVHFYDDDPDDDGSGVNSQELTSPVNDTVLLGASMQGTVIAVMKTETGRAGSDFAANISGAAIRGLFVNGSSVFARAFDGTLDDATKTGWVDNAYKIICWQKDATNVIAYLHDLDTAAAATTASGAQTTTGIAPVAGQALLGSIAELIFFASVLTESQRRLVGLYLSKKYNLTNDSSATSEDTYTVEQNTTTSKFTFTRATGTSTFSLMFGTGPNKAQSFAIDLGFTETDKTGATSYEAGSIVIRSREWLKIDFGAATTINALAIAGSSMPGSSMTLLGNDTDVWTAPAFTIVPGGGPPIVSQLFTETRRFWLLRLHDQVTADPKVGPMYLGGFVSPSICHSIRHQIDRDELSPVLRAIRGAHYYDARPKLYQWSMEWSHITIADRQILEAVADARPPASPFFFIFDNVSPATSTYYVVWRGGLAISFSPHNRWTVTGVLEEAV